MENQYYVTALKQLKLHVAAGPSDLKDEPLEDAEVPGFPTAAVL